MTVGGPEHPTDDLVLPLKEFAERLEQSHYTVERWFRDGRCGFKRAGRYYITHEEARVVARFHKQEIETGPATTPSNVVPISDSVEAHRPTRPEIMERQIFELEQELDECGDKVAELHSQLRKARARIRRLEREQ